MQTQESTRLLAVLLPACSHSLLSWLADAVHGGGLQHPGAGHAEGSVQGVHRCDLCDPDRAAGSTGTAGAAHLRTGATVFVLAPTAHASRKAQQLRTPAEFPPPIRCGRLTRCVSGVQVGDVIDIVFHNSLPNAVNLVLNGGLIPDSPSYLTAAISSGETVRLS